MNAIIEALKAGKEVKHIGVGDERDFDVTLYVDNKAYDSYDIPEDAIMLHAFDEAEASEEIVMDYERSGNGVHYYVLAAVGKV